MKVQEPVSASAFGILFKASLDEFIARSLKHEVAVTGRPNCLTYTMEEWVLQFLAEQDIMIDPVLDMKDTTVEVASDLLKLPVGSDTRSVPKWIRLCNGDLLLGVYPTGDNYEELTQGSKHIEV